MNAKMIDDEIDTKRQRVKGHAIAKNFDGMFVWVIMPIQYKILGWCKPTVVPSVSMTRIERITNLSTNESQSRNSKFNSFPADRLLNLNVNAQTSQILATASYPYNYR